MRIAIALVLILTGLAFPARADDLASAQAMIRAQDEAISRDDAAAAFSYAAPVIKRVFSQPEIFMAMVRQGYAPLYKPRSFEFGKGQVLDGGVVQIVYLTDADGVAWEALYTLERQQDGSLKITGCTIKKATTA
ncbi:MAG: DUF4864 domain-containing protein [Pseudomonadota bacterium]|jgi:Domain of unknown function (DUF4864)